MLDILSYILSSSTRLGYVDVSIVSQFESCKDTFITGTVHVWITSICFRNPYSISSHEVDCEGLGRGIRRVLYSERIGTLI